jgi:uncharacterized protein
MVDNDNRLKELEDELRNTAYNKRTQFAVGLLKAKIARIREKLQSRGGGGGGYSYSVRKSGDATVILVGFPSVGKSTLLNTLTNAKSETAAYAFTTVDVVPGLMTYKHAQIQILDVPGILEGASTGKGRGREVLSVMRSCDLVLFLVDINFPEHYPVLQKEVYDSGLRINARKPDVKIIRKSRGGISIGTTVKLTHLNAKTVSAILREFHINNADIVIRTDITSDELIDVIESNKHYIPGLTVLTKIDMQDEKKRREVEKLVKPDNSISAETGEGIELLREKIFEKLSFIRVFCKEAGKKADMDVPLIMRRGCTVEDVANKLHRDFVKKFKSAKVWGPSAKFPGQKLGLKHAVLDTDVVEINLT